MTSYRSKVLKIYKSKGYEMDVMSFLNFVQQKVEVDQMGFDLITEKIEQFEFEPQSLNEKQFGLLVKIVAAATQLKYQKVKGMNRSQIQEYQGKIVFKSSKNTQNKQTQSNQSSPISPKYKKNQQSDKKGREKNQQQKPNLTQNIQKSEVQISEQNDQNNENESLQKGIKRLGTIEQVYNSSEIININVLNREEHPKFLDMKESKDEFERAKITHYEKFSADYVNPVIKYTICYQKHKVLRRFSEFQKLINILREQYEGFILPKLPPKEGIKAGINYFWGIDENFLEQRRKKLQQMLNRLLQNKFINNDNNILNMFLTDQSFQIQHNKEGYGAYFKGLTDIVFNAKQLKDLGVAYYNYFREKGNVKLNPQIQNKYTQILQIVDVFNAVNSYRKKINVNFDKRRQIFHEAGVKLGYPQSFPFDKLMNAIEEEIQDLNFQFENYRDLKSKQSWITELIKQKQGDGQKNIYELRDQQEKLKSRIQKIENNLKRSLDQFEKDKVQRLQKVSDQVIVWRENVHPSLRVD